MGVLKKFLGLLFVPLCVSCRALLPYDGAGGERVFCHVCRSEWEKAKLEPCAGCGAAAMDCRCVPRLPEGEMLDGLIRLASYDPDSYGDTVNLAVLNLKRRRDGDAFGLFAKQLAALLKGRLSELGIAPGQAIITYCPRRISARSREGFDQSEELARRLAAECGAEFAVLIKRRAFVFADEQKKLSSQQRFENARCSLAAARKAGVCSGRCVVVVDDVVTTGASLAACAGILRRAGAARVFGACIASVPAGAHNRHKA